MHFSEIFEKKAKKGCQRRRLTERRNASYSSAARKAVFGTDGLQHGTIRKAKRIEEGGVAVELLRLFPNLYGELSDAIGILKQDEDFAIRFLTEFQDKLFFGTDSCNSTCDANYQGKLWFDALHDSGRLPEEAWKKICRNNAIDFFHLDLKKA